MKNEKDYKKMIEKEIQMLTRNIRKIGENTFKAEESNETYEVLGELDKTVKEVFYKIQDRLIETEESKKIYIDSNNKLKELDKTKNNFLSTVSHEFRVPLTSIMGFSKIMKKKFNKIIMPQIEKAKNENLNYDFNKLEGELIKTLENIDIIVSESERLTSMINNILDIAKIEAGQVQWDKEFVDISEVINKAILTTYSILNSKDIELIDLMQEKLPLVYCDKDKIFQVLINLLSNAVKFTEKGYIKCEVKFDEYNVYISVEDTGCGILKEDLDDIFERFKQVGDVLKDKPKGSGLGLTISKAIIEQHGGQIWVESNVGLGSKFTFTLPLDLEVN